MASSKAYLDFILDQLSGLDEISYRSMMGEYIIYYRGKVIGGIYDDRFLVKPTKSAAAMMPDADLELPYEGVKVMLLVDDVENREFLRELFENMYDELPAEKRRNEFYEYQTVCAGSHKIPGGAPPGRTAAFPSCRDICLLAGLAADHYSFYPYVHCRTDHDEEKS